MNEKYLFGVKVYFKNGVWQCDFEDYKKARQQQGRKWSEKSFCDWCDSKGIEANG